MQARKQKAGFVAALLLGVVGIWAATSVPAIRDREIAPYVPLSGLLLLAAAAVIAVGCGFLRSSGGNRDELRPMQVISWWWLLAGLLAVIVAAWLSFATLSFVANSSPSMSDQAKLRFDAVKTSLTVGAGAAGLIALVLGFRRQWLSERAQSHLEYDAREQRVTDLYTKAADQLGHDKAAVRLAGLYALERVAQGNPEHRQTVVDVICAYLRMPLPAPGPSASAQELRQGEDGDSNGPTEEARELQEELHVRSAAQGILFKHLKRRDSDLKANASFWQSIDINLSGAHLRAFALEDSELRRAVFHGATFEDGCFLARVTFEGQPWGTRGPYGIGGVEFNGCTFRGDLTLEDVKFSGDASFSGAQVQGHAYFGGTTFAGEADFSEVTFESGCHFEASRFDDAANFKLAEFRGDLEFNDGIIFADGTTTFGGLETSFERATFLRCVDFTRAKFTGKPVSDAATPNGVSFEGAIAKKANDVSRNWPTGWTVKPGQGKSYLSIVATTASSDDPDVPGNDQPDDGVSEPTGDKGADPTGTTRSTPSAAG
ncbi:pentapeptide repeat-containing protein [Micromonospora chalcea]|uniref:pentapeptide repeat-containing protein n=1 Tax=Micromonospora chalcea TaxID=1874 RepID=UPI0033ED42EA